MVSADLFQHYILHFSVLSALRLQLISHWRRTIYATCFHYNFHDLYLLADEEAPNEDKYRSGFNSCFNEVLNFISSNESCKPEIRAKVLSHLADKFTSSKMTKCVSSNPGYLHDDVQYRKTCSPSANKLIGQSQSQSKTYETTNHIYDQNNNVYSIPNSDAVNLAIDKGVSLAKSSSITPDNCITSGTVTATQTLPGALQFTNPVNVNGQITLLVPTNVISGGNSCVIPIAVPSVSPGGSTLLVACSSSGTTSPVPETRTNTVQRYSDNDQTNLPNCARPSGQWESNKTCFQSSISQERHSRNNTTFPSCDVKQIRQYEGNKLYSPCDDRQKQQIDTSLVKVNNNNNIENHCLNNGFHTDASTNIITHHHSGNALHTYGMMKQNTGSSKVYRPSEAESSKYELNAIPSRQFDSDRYCTMLNNHKTFQHGKVNVWRPWNV